MPAHAWRFAQIGAGRFAAAVRFQGLVVGDRSPNSAADWPEDPGEITGAGCDLDQIIGIRCLGDNGWLAIQVVGIVAEGALALHGFRRISTGAQAGNPLDTGHVPGAQFPCRFHGGHVEVFEVVPTLVDLQSGTGDRTKANGAGAFHLGQPGRREAMPVQRHHNRRVGIGDGRQRDSHQRQSG